MKVKLIFAAIFLTVFYLLSSFIAWEFNPYNWEAAGRAMFGFFSGLGLLIIAAKLD